jgi:hypothetical protein
VVATVSDVRIWQEDTLYGSKPYRSQVPCGWLGRDARSQKRRKFSHGWVIRRFAPHPSRCSGPPFGRSPALHGVITAVRMRLGSPSEFTESTMWNGCPSDHVNAEGASIQPTPHGVEK